MGKIINKIINKINKTLAPKGVKLKIIGKANSYIRYLLLKGERELEVVSLDGVFYRESAEEMVFSKLRDKKNISVEEAKEIFAEKFGNTQGAKQIVPCVYGFGDPIKSVYKDGDDWVVHYMGVEEVYSPESEDGMRRENILKDYKVIKRVFSPEDQWRIINDMLLREKIENMSNEELSKILGKTVVDEVKDYRVKISLSEIADDEIIKFSERYKSFRETCEEAEIKKVYKSINFEILSFNPEAYKMFMVSENKKKGGVMVFDKRKPGFFNHIIKNLPSIGDKIYVRKEDIIDKDRFFIINNYIFKSEYETKKTEYWKTKAKITELLEYIQKKGVNVPVVCDTETEVKLLKDYFEK